MANQHRWSYQQPVADNCARSLDHHHDETFHDRAGYYDTAHHEFAVNNAARNDVAHANSNNSHHATYGTDDTANRDDTARGDATAFGDTASTDDAAGHGNADTKPGTRA
jgi:hypothetical protein